MKDNLFIYELASRFDSRLSFYGKAIIKEDYKKRYLYSYCTLVATIEKESEKITLNKEVEESLLFSQTTSRHIKEFIKQFTSKNIKNKKELLKIKRG